MSEVGFKSYFLELLKAVLVAVILSLIFVLISSAVFKFSNLDTSLVVVFNVVIKALACLLSCLICFRLPSLGWLRGALLGVAFALISNLVYSAVAGENPINIGLLADALLCLVAGSIGGIIAVNVKKPAIA
jgi:putative membrane protein (TIGR04086 family)